VFSARNRSDDDACFVCPAIQKHYIQNLAMYAIKHIIEAADSSLRVTPHLMVKHLLLSG